jgi:hypothetical protein
MMNSVLTASLTSEEYGALTNAFNRYLKSVFQSEKIDKDARGDLANELVAQFKDTMLMNPSVRAKYEASEKRDKELTFFRLNNNDISNLTTERDICDYQNQQNCISPLKARCLILGLEIRGFYVRPQERPKHALFDAVMTEVFSAPQNRKTKDALRNMGVPEATVGESEDFVAKKGEKDEVVEPGLFTEKVINELVGTYQVFRLSLNSSFPDHITTHILKIYQDSDADGVNALCYSTRNRYSQKQTNDNSDSLERVRKSQGHVFNYQGQIFMLGAVTYTHLNETEPSSTDKHRYPEVMMLHMHGGDRKSIRGLILGHYPFLGLPVATTVYMSKLSKIAASKLDGLEHLLLAAESEGKKADLTEEFATVAAQYFGNVDPNAKVADLSQISDVKGVKEGLAALIDAVKENAKFVTNTIESKYSKMLTP